MIRRTWRHRSTIVVREFRLLASLKVRPFVSNPRLPLADIPSIFACVLFLFTG